MDKFLIIFIFGFYFCPFLKGNTTTQVTTYVVKTQEERESTRFTLTKWLQIKERMKMMDVWLAMFSNKDHHTFKPEVHFSYYKKQATIEWNQNQASIEAKNFRTQIFLTNLISSTTGAKVLNVDFGLEGALESISQVKADDTGLSYNPYTQYGLMNFRIFGRNIQDSSLILKYGQFRKENHNLYPVAKKTIHKGMLVGLELQLYILPWLGLEGHHLEYERILLNDQIAEKKDIDQEAMAFIEIANLRFLLGRYKSTKSMFDAQNQKQQVIQNGVLAGLRVYF